MPHPGANGSLSAIRRIAACCWLCLLVVTGLARAQAVQPVPALDRQGLHAYRLAFDHPVTHQPLLFQIDLPADMSRALLDWGLGYNPAP